MKHTKTHLILIAANVLIFVTAIFNLTGVFRIPAGLFAIVGALLLLYGIFLPNPKLPSLEAIELKYGHRPRIPAGHGEPLLTHHFRGELDDGTKFVYCPVGYICSWSEGDYDHRWCHWCKKYFYEFRRDNVKPTN